MTESESSSSTRARRTAKSPSSPRARTRRTQAERREQTRTQILEVSSQLIRSRGVSGLRTQEVAELAGVSQGAQFHHFPTKDDLVIATFAYVHDKFVQRSRWQPSAESSLAEVIDHIIEDAFDFYFDDAFYLDLALGIDGQSPLLDKVQKRIITSRFQAETAWREALEAKGLRRSIARDVLAMTLSLVRGFGVRHLMERDKPQFLRLSRWWSKIILDYLASHNELSTSRNAKKTRS
ncbi:TetR/AcrR family transcriptional regulator [Bradyrhizobium betae]|uniref:HTH tetR-type domain-containing protein n=1 Tax=Bradyrhizobium betae TaxID=244734 RepID=A0A4Q1VNS4_9BRAD|nr:TetR/AcrR family transcriptional regulator [Bradyrhizobium betae]RXT54238.1 hypothetical protein B5V03_02000 [Bradyrhizobium betae]